MTDFDDEFPVDVDSARRVARALRVSSSAAGRLVDEHEAEHGEVLPTLLLDLIATWFRTAVSAPTDDAHAALAATTTLADLWLAGGEGMETVIATGFLEALPHEDEADRWVVDRLPPLLREELRKMEDWRPTAGT